MKGYLRKDDCDLLSFERMISTFWVLCPDFLSSCCSASLCNLCYPWILRVWLRCSVCLLSVLLYLHRNESAWKADSRISSQGWWVSRLVVRDLWPLAVDESFLLSSPRMHTQLGIAVLNWWVLRDIGEKWFEEWYNIPVIHDLQPLTFFVPNTCYKYLRVLPGLRRFICLLPCTVLWWDLSYTHTWCIVVALYYITSTLPTYHLEVVLRCWGFSKSSILLTEAQNDSMRIDTCSGGQSLKLTTLLTVYVLGADLWSTHFTDWALISKRGRRALVLIKTQQK